MINEILARIELQLLMNLTARALQQPTERIWTLSAGEALRAYATFTRRYLQGTNSQERLSRLNQEAYRMGQQVRRWFPCKREAAARRLVAMLYRHIGIDMQFLPSGELCFHSCYFSRFYTPSVCIAASAIDDGIIRGVMGQTAGKLHFSQRITEGCKCCMATIK